MTGARRSWPTSPSSPAARWSARTSASSSTRSASRCSAPPGGSPSPRTTPRSSTAAARQRRIGDRVAQIRREIEDTDSDWDREKLQERLAKLAGGIGVIRVGAATEVELKERKHRIEDAIAATRAAVEEGVVPGGGSALVHAAAAIDGLDLTGDELTGARAVRRALDAPLRADRRRTPGFEGRVVVSKVRDLGVGQGFNAATGEYGDLAKQGVIDPVKVTKAALGNAASIAAMVLTTDSAVVEKPEEEEHAHGRRAPHARPLARRGHGHSH